MEVYARLIKEVGCDKAYEAGLFVGRSLVTQHVDAAAERVCAAVLSTLRVDGQVYLRSHDMLCVVCRAFAWGDDGAQFVAGVFSGVLDGLGHKYDADVRAEHNAHIFTLVQHAERRAVGHEHEHEEMTLHESTSL